MRWRDGNRAPSLCATADPDRKEDDLDRCQFPGESGNRKILRRESLLRNIRLPALLVDKVIQVVAAAQPEHYILVSLFRSLWLGANKLPRTNSYGVRTSPPQWVKPP